MLALGKCQKTDPHLRVVGKRNHGCLMHANMPATPNGPLAWGVWPGSAKNLGLQTGLWPWPGELFGACSFPTHQTGLWPGGCQTQLLCAGGRLKKLVPNKFLAMRLPQLADARLGFKQANWLGRKHGHREEEMPASKQTGEFVRWLLDQDKRAASLVSPPLRPAQQTGWQLRRLPCAGR